MATADARVIAPAQTDVPPTPAAEHATLPARLPLDTLALIGVAGAPDTRIAFLRDRNGQIRPVRIGDDTPKGRVEAIGADEVILARAGKSLRLSMPE